MNLSLTIDPFRFGSESRVLIIVLGVILPRLILAQSASPGVSAGTAVPSPITVLNPYVVDMTLDRGYQATNTLSGSRLNSSLRDTPSSISVFTKEFLQDVGLDDLGELVGYSVNSEVDEFDTGSASHADQVNSQYLVKVITTRGIRASQGLDYFKSITPDDAYRVERYDDSRGPNSILFGISDAGGLLNQTSKAAHLRQNAARIKWSGGSYDRNRSEFDFNKVLRKDQLAVSLAGVHQENGGWKLYDFQDRQRLFGSVLFRPHRRFSITLMGESGRDTAATVPAYTAGDNALAWLDNRDARGIDAVTFVPNNTNPTPAQIALGVTTRNAVANGTNHRLSYITNNGILFDSVGTFLTGSYNNPGVRAPDGSPGVSGEIIRINDPSLMPYEVNAHGPGMFRDVRLDNYTVSADWQIMKGFHANLGHNYQKTDLTAYFMPGAANPSFRGEPNRTLGVGGPANPYAGELYFEGNWRKGRHPMERKENRLSLAYEFSKPRWGSHRLAAMASRAHESNTSIFTWLALAGAPFGGAPDGANNRLSTRQYITAGDTLTYTGGSWRDVPRSVTFGDRSYDVIWANGVPGPQNNASEQELDTGLLVVQSHFLDRRLVTTFGYRDDRSTMSEFGHRTDAIFGPVPDKSLITAETESRGITRTQGAVLHVLPSLSLVANFSSSVGLPDYTRRVFPKATIAAPSRGSGRDYGVAVELWDRKLTAKAVYFETAERGNVALFDTVGLSTNRSVRIMDAFETVLTGVGRPISTPEWQALREELAPAVSGASADVASKGYEFSAIANPTSNLRLTINYAYTDRSVENLYNADVIPWYGFILQDGLIRQGVTQDAEGRFHVDSSAYETGRTVARWIELSRRHPEAALSTLTTANGDSIAEEIFLMTEGLNGQKREEEKRWGLRPHRISLFAAYDFQRETRLNGVSVGGGFRWRSANIIGTDSNGREITGRSIEETDFMLRYARTLEPRLWKGRLILQLNVINVFNQRGIIPKYFSANPPYEVPGGRGLAYNRFDIIAPRTVRFTTTYEF